MIGEGLQECVQMLEGLWLAPWFRVTGDTEIMIAIWEGLSKAIQVIYTIQTNRITACRRAVASPTPLLISHVAGSTK
jgi:hypothetical protein